MLCIETQWGRAPDTAALFPLDGPCEAPGADGPCRQCGACTGQGPLTPRNAMLVYLAAAKLGDEVRAALDADRLDDVRALLPPACTAVDRVWLERFHRSVRRAEVCIARGEVPWPTCTGDEMALNLGLDEVDGLVATELYRGFAASLPAHDDDGDTAVLTEVLLEDTDVLVLFDPALEGVEEDPETAATLGLVNMRTTQWFLPFHP